MSFFDSITSNDEVENLATELALLYIRKSDKAISNPEDIARQFFEAQKAIFEELKTIHLEQ